MQKLPTRISLIIEELIDQYNEEDRYNCPWIIGFSGGKDSTVLLTLVWLALQKIKKDNPNVELERHIYERICTVVKEDKSIAA
jgi:DNA sulfur modification protein DndC